MKKIILTFVVATFSLVAFSQAPPPPPPPGINPGGPGTSGPTGKRVAAAPIGGDLIILSLLAGGYALSRKRRLLSVDKEQQNVG